MPQSQEHSFIAGRNVRPLKMTKDQVTYDTMAELQKIGISLDTKTVRAMHESLAMDSNQNLVTTASIPGLIQFLQTWIPGFVSVMTQARPIDELIGVQTIGKWEDEEVIQGLMENTGLAIPYTDLGNVPLANWNLQWERRTIVRFESGIRVGLLEEARAGRVNVDTASVKRTSAALALDVQRNSVGFLGFNGGANRTYGFLNDPTLPAYVTVAATGTGASTTWPNKTFQNIQADLRTAIQQLRTQCAGNVDPFKTPITLVLPTDKVDYLGVTTDFGESVQDWLNKTYPMIRITSAPQLNLVNGGADVFYMFADSFSDTSTDDGRTWLQVVPTKFKLLGVQQLVKGYEEDYSSAFGGVMLKRPYGVVRYSGI